MYVRPYDVAYFAPCKGDISLGGAKVTLSEWPLDKQIEVLVHLGSQELRLQGEIIDVIPGNPLHTARVKFQALLLEDERAIARFLDDVSGEWDVWTGEH